MNESRFLTGAIVSTCKVLIVVGIAYIAVMLASCVSPKPEQHRVQPYELVVPIGFGDTPYCLSRENLNE